MTKNRREFWISGIDFESYTLERNEVCAAFISLIGSSRPEAIKVTEIKEGEQVYLKDDVEHMINLLRDMAEPLGDSSNLSRQNLLDILCDYIAHSEEALKRLESL